MKVQSKDILNWLWIGVVMIVSAVIFVAAIYFFQSPEDPTLDQQIQNENDSLQQEKEANDADRMDFMLNN